MGSDKKWITERDYDRSQTTHMLPYLYDALRPLRGKPIDRLLDIGCGFGGLTQLVGDHLGIREAHGVDIDEIALNEATEKGVKTRRLDIGDGDLPFGEGFFDLVISFGVLDYLPEFDPMLREIFRVLKPGGRLYSRTFAEGWKNLAPYFRRPRLGGYIRRRRDSLYAHGEGTRG